MDEFIPIVAMVLVLGPVATWAVALSPLGRALADRWRGETGGSDDRVLDLQDDIDRLKEHLLDQERRLEEVHDRLDFTERLLTKQTEIPPSAKDVETPV